MAASAGDGNIADGGGGASAAVDTDPDGISDMNNLLDSVETKATALLDAMESVAPAEEVLAQHESLLVDFGLLEQAVEGARLQHVAPLERIDADLVEETKGITAELRAVEREREKLHAWAKHSHEELVAAAEGRK